MFFSIQRINLSASDLFISESVKIGPAHIEALCIKSKNRHIGKTEVVPFRSLKNDKQWFLSCDWILTNRKTI